MGVKIRAIREDEASKFHQAMTAPFGFDVDDEMRSQFLKVFEAERMRAAFDGDQIVGTLGVHTLELSVPGGSLPMAGTTTVTVLPTHRRQGVMRRMLNQHLHDAHQKDECLAGLWASESNIYGRFGYGVASDRLMLDVEAAYAKPARPIDLAGRTRMVDKDEAIATFPDIYDRVRSRRPGMLSRKPSWWSARRLADSEYQREGATKQRRVLLETEGRHEGYLVYRTATSENGTVLRIVELMAIHAQAELALWQFAFSHDLAASIEYKAAPPDTPALWMLEQPRKLNRRLEDALWIRIVDVVKALSGRTYEAPGTIRFQLVDNLCDWNHGVFQLTVDDAGNGRCQQSDGEADLRMDISQLGAIYLGGRSCRELAAAGLIEGEAEPLRRAEQMFRTFPAPWCPEIF